MNTTIRRTGLLLGSLVLLAGHAPAAQAATWKGTDVAGDVEVTTCTNPADESTCTTALKPGVYDGDIVAARVVHGDGKVVVTTRHRALTKQLDRIFLAMIVTNEGKRRIVVAGAMAGQGQPSFTMLLKPDGTQVSCGSVGARIDGATKSAILRVGRGCLSNPRWVKVAALTNESSDDETIDRWDQALRKGPSDSPVFSAQVRNN